MNIGLSIASGNAIIFLNAGDVFFCADTVKLIGKEFSPGKCLAGRSLQVFNRDGYVRPAMARLKELSSSPCHQSFVAPLPQSKGCHFNENRKISSDVEWMRQTIQKYNVTLSPTIISKFQLGGISNNPSVATIKTRYHDSGLKRGILEAIKFSLKILFGLEKYYALLLSYKSENREIDDER
jgi:hypothetical protein